MNIKDEIKEISFETGAGVIRIINIWNMFPKATKEDIIEIINCCKISNPDDNVKRLYKHLK